jgi:hypothetical protein
MIHTAERFVEKQAAFEAALATCRAIDFFEVTRRVPSICFAGLLQADLGG